MLIPPGQIAAIADAVVDLLEDPERRAGMGQAGRALVEERFNMYNWARRLAEIYAGVPSGALLNVPRTTN
jgi:glycosyltransferase involved in cell wall biosynthesis